MVDPTHQKRFVQRLLLVDSTAAFHLPFDGIHSVYPNLMVELLRITVVPTSAMGKGWLWGAPINSIQKAAAMDAPGSFESETDWTLPTR